MPSPSSAWSLLNTPSHVVRGAAASVAAMKIASAAPPMRRLAAGGMICLKASMHGRLVACVLVVLCSTGRVSAHHSFASEFDSSRTLTLDGIVVAMEWVNPHSSLTIDVTDKHGRSERWMIELSPPNTLVRRGWRKTSIRAGDRVVAMVFPSRDGRRFAALKSLTLADGRQL